MEWHELQDIGQRPSPRIQHTMNYIVSMAILVIFGGKDERLEN